MDNSSSSPSSPLNSLPWDDASVIANFNGVPTETLQYALDEANHDQVFKSALESLRSSNPNTTFEEAEKLVERMRDSAKKVLESRK